MKRPNALIHMVQLLLFQIFMHVKYKAWTLIDIRALHTGTYITNLDTERCVSILSNNSNFINKLLRFDRQHSLLPHLCNIVFGSAQKHTNTHVCICIVSHTKRYNYVCIYQSKRPSNCKCCRPCQSAYSNEFPWANKYYMYFMKTQYNVYVCSNGIFAANPVVFTYMHYCVHFMYRC